MVTIDSKERESEREINEIKEIRKREREGGRRHRLVGTRC